MPQKLALPPGATLVEDNQTDNDASQLPPGATNTTNDALQLPPGATLVNEGSTEKKAPVSTQDQKPGLLERADTAITNALAPNAKSYTSFGRTQLEVPKTLGREAYSAGKTVLGMIDPRTYYHAFADAPTEEEKQKYAQFEKEEGEAPGTETSGLKRVGVGLGRILGTNDIDNAIKYWTDVAKGKQHVDTGDILSVAPEAIGTGAGVELGGKGIEHGLPKVVEAGKTLAPKVTQIVKDAAPNAEGVKKTAAAPIRAVAQKTPLAPTSLKEFGLPGHEKTPTGVLKEGEQFQSKKGPQPYQTVTPERTRQGYGQAAPHATTPVEAPAVEREPGLVGPQHLEGNAPAPAPAAEAPTPLGRIGYAEPAPARAVDLVGNDFVPENNAPVQGNLALAPERFGYIEPQPTRALGLVGNEYTEGQTAAGTAKAPSPIGRIEYATPTEREITPAEVKSSPGTSMSDGAKTLLNQILGTEEAKPAEAAKPAETAAKPKESKGVPEVANLVNSFNESKGRGPVEAPKSEAHPRGKEIADAYEAMEHNPSDPKVKASYDALKNTIDEQWDHAVKNGFKFEPTDKDPYKSSKEMREDVAKNKRLSFFTGGDLPKDHPMSELDPKTGLTYNDKFRAVHDLYGHAAHGNEFGAGGEEAAFKTHAATMPKEAIPALAAETRGQNNWVNFGKHLRDTAGEIPKKGETGYVAPKDRPFAKQKAGMLPEEFHSDVVAKAVEKAEDKWPPNKIVDHVKGGKDFAILQAENPQNTRISDAENAKLTEQLAKELKDKGYEPVPVGGNTKDVAGVKENAFFVPDIKPKDAAEIGRKFKQQGILTSEGLHDLNTDKVTPLKRGELLTGDEARKQQYYTTIGNEDVHFPLEEKEAPAKGKENGKAEGRFSADEVAELKKLGMTDAEIEQLNKKPAAKAEEAPKTKANGSAPGAAGADSIEALNRQAEEKSKGIKRIKVLQNGQEVPLIGPDAVDAVAGKGETIVKRYADGHEEIQDQGQGARYSGPKGTTGHSELTDLEQETYHPLVKEQVSNLDNESLKKLGKAYGLNPDDYNFQRREPLREGGSKHPVERYKFVDDLMSKIPADEKENIGRAAEEAKNNPGTFKDVDKSSKGRAERARSLFPKLREAEPEPEVVRMPLGELTGKMKAKGPAPEATAETAKMSDEELLKKGFTKEDIEAGKHLPAAGGGAAGAAAAAAKGIPEEFAKHMTQQEIDSVSKTPGIQQKFLNTMAKIPSVQEYLDIALQGEGARKWYQRSAKAFDAMSKEAPKYFDQEGDKDKFIGLLASTSPRQSVAMNLREGLGMWKEWVDAGRPTEEKPLRKLLDRNLTTAGSKIPNAIKALTGTDLWPDIKKNKAFKVPSFDKNLKGWLNYSTNDGWMAMFAGVDPNELSDPHSYHPLSVATRAAAKELGWETAEAQAAIWSFTQALTERGEELPEEIRRASEDYVDILQNDKMTRDLLADLGVNHENLDTKLRAIEAKPEVTGRTTATTPGSVGALKGRIEAARGEGAIPPPKSGQGKLFGGENSFREPPAREGRVRQPEPEDTSFNPNEFEMNEPGKKKKESRLGRISSK